MYNSYTSETPRKKISKTQRSGVEFGLKYHLNRDRGEGNAGLLGESKFLGEIMNGPLKEWTGGMIVCDSLFSLLPCDENQSSLVAETSRKKIYDN